MARLQTVLRQLLPLTYSPLEPTDFRDHVRAELGDSVLSAVAPDQTTAEALCRVLDAASRGWRGWATELRREQAMGGKRSARDLARVLLPRFLAVEGYKTHGLDVPPVGRPLRLLVRAQLTQRLPPTTVASSPSSWLQPSVTTSARVSGAQKKWQQQGVAPSAGPSAAAAPPTAALSTAPSASVPAVPAVPAAERMDDAAKKCAKRRERRKRAKSCTQ